MGKTTFRHVVYVYGFLLCLMASPSVLFNPSPQGNSLKATHTQNLISAIFEALIKFL